MQDGNSSLSDAVRESYTRIKTLRAISQKTGLKTDQEQFKVLIGLPNDDALAVVDLLYKEGKGTQNSTVRS